MAGKYNYSGDEGVPGPGAYKPNAVTPRAPSYTMYGRNAVGNLNDTPGPGQYKQEKILKSSPKYTFAGKPKAGYGDNTPGPGQYRTNNYHVYKPVFIYIFTNYYFIVK